MDKQLYINEVEYQIKMLNNLKRWLRNCIIFSSLSLRNLFISSLKASIIFRRLDLMSFSCDSLVLEYPQ